MSDANQITEMEGNRTETRPAAAKCDVDKTDVSVEMDETASPNLCKLTLFGKKALAENQTFKKGVDRKTVVV